MRLRFALLTLPLWIALVAPARAQCPAVSIGTYGQGCAIQFDVPGYKAGFDATNCAIDFGYSGLPGCCNSFLTARVVMFGFQQASLPAPAIGPGCLLLLQPTIFAVLPANVTQLSAPIPSLPPGTSFVVYSQYLNQYTTFGVQNDYNASNGVAIKMAF